MMALQVDPQRNRNIYITHLEGDGPFLKITGQLDKDVALLIESIIELSQPNFDKGIGAASAAAIVEGMICVAKYKDGKYYRAKVTNTASAGSGLINVYFIDYGNKDVISISSIRLLDNYDVSLVQIPGLATDYLLSRFMPINGCLDEQVKLKIQNILCYGDYTYTIDAQTFKYPLISVNYQGTDLSEHLVMVRYGHPVPVIKQEALLQQLHADGGHQAPILQRSYSGEPAIYNEHVQFLNNQNFPSNPASTMRLQQNISTFNYNRSYTSLPSTISQRLLIDKTASRNVVPTRTQIRTGRIVPAAALTPPPQSPIVSPKSSPKKVTTYKSRLLEIHSRHNVYVSYADEGPELFAVQLESDVRKLEILMADINKQPLHSLTEPPMIGTVCLGREQELKLMARAIVMNLSGANCKLFFVDFGNTKMVSYYEIFDIPEEFVKPNVFAMRFCLSGVKKLGNVPSLTERFKQLVKDKLLTIKVVPQEGPPLIQYAELYLDNQNVLDLLLATPKSNLQFKWMDMLPMGCERSVLVSYVDSCIKFFVQLSDMIDQLNVVMDNVRIHCEHTSSPGQLPVGSACCAKFPDDNNWYRAHIMETKGNKVVVAYVDYGNEQEIDVSDLRTITLELIQLPAQAIRCALKGFETKSVETKTSNQLEMLALEKTLMAHVVGTLSNDTMLVTLINETVSPPLDIARRMLQLSLPRSTSNQENKQPLQRTDSSFSSPDSEDGKKKYQREKSFREERKPRDEDLGQRGGSFRGKDRENNFDRSGPGRYSEKFTGKQDRGDRRGGSKPWENKDNPTKSGDEWDDNSQSSTHQPDRQNRFNRGGSKPWENKDNPSKSGDEWEENAKPSSNQYNKPNRDNRSSSKPWENKREPISAANDEWEEDAASQPAHHTRQNRDRRKPRTDQQDRFGQKSTWKPKVDGVNKRLTQAAQENSTFGHRGSVQDRLRRDNRYNKQEDREENKNNDWENKNSYGGDRRDRPERRDNRGERRDNYSDRSDDNKRNFRDRGEKSNWTPRSNFTPRDRGDRSFGSDDKKTAGTDRFSRTSTYKPRETYTQVRSKELPDPVPLETPLTEPSVEPGAQHEVSVTWIISPESFYTQILSLQPKFLEMMQSIPDIYKGVKPYSGDIPVGASVVARYPEDGVLYRATIVSVQPFGKFIVQYVDFGNKFIVDARDIWQLDRQLLELPKMAVHCSLLGVAPKDGEWKANNDIDLCFNAPRYQCVFQDCVEGVHKVSLWNNGVSVAETLVEKELAIAEQTSAVTLKDEAIDLTIIVGQQMLCRVTHVESFDEFYLQLDLDKATAVEDTIAKFDSSLLTPIPADSLCEEIHCTVRHEGEIYRAKLVDVSDPTKIQAVLPDYGKTVTVPVENVMILPTELSVYYYQSLECCFNNYTSESNQLMTLEQLKETLTGNKLIAYINDVDGVRVVTTLYDLTTGKKIAAFEPDEGAYDEVVQLCTRAVYNYSFGMAILAHAENLNEIYLQRVSDIERIETMLNDLYAFYEEGTPEAIEDLQPEVLCAAKASDGNWYRATVVSITEAECKVQFSDYGNMETIPLDSVKKLDSKFYEPSALALVASLGLVALQDDALEKLKEWIADKEIQVTLSCGTDGWLASLHLDGVDLSMKLVNEQLATPRVTPTEEPKAERATEEPFSLPPGCTQVYISHIDSPGQFYLQMADKIDEIEQIQADLQTNTETYPDIESREIGTLCVAKYTADDMWYRAEILDSDADITTVRFIDYGNADVLDNKPGLLKVMPDHLKTVERLAVKSSVNAIPTGTGQWSEPASDYFSTLVGDVSLPVDALIVLKDIYTYVDLFVNGENVTDKLVSEGHANRSEETDSGDWPSCFASHVNSPAEFWIQLESAAPELQAMETAMVDAENFPELETKEEGVLCAAKYPEDGAWYRAQVIVDGSEGTEVLFMDYGNASIATELRSLPEELKVKPALSRKCALQKPRDIKNWSRKSEMKFNDIAAEGATVFNVQFIAAGDISIVGLYHEGKSVTEELVGLCEPLPQAERLAPLGQDQRNTGKLSYINQLDEFYIQLDDKSSELDKVVDKLVESEDFAAVSELKVGSLCAAFCDEDEQWYRVKILEFCDIGAHVQFIDYGNKAKCEIFKQLPEDLVVIEPLAKCCRLAGLADAELHDETLKNNLDNYLNEEESFQIEFLDSTKEPMLVKLLLNNEDISNLIRNLVESKTQNNINDEIVQDNTCETETFTENKLTSLQPDQDLSISQDDAFNTSKPEQESSISQEDNALVTSHPKQDLSISQDDAFVTSQPDQEFSVSQQYDTLVTSQPDEDLSVSQKDDALFTSQPDLNESGDSNKTVIINESFSPSTNCNVEMNETNSEKTQSLEITPVEVCAESLEASSEAVKTPGRDESKESVATDTGYTSEVDHEKSPVNDLPKDKDTIVVNTENIEVIKTTANDNKPEITDDNTNDSFEGEIEENSVSIKENTNYIEPEVTELTSHDRIENEIDEDKGTDVKENMENVKLQDENECEKYKNEFPKKHMLEPAVSAGIKENINDIESDITELTSNDRIEDKVDENKYTNIRQKLENIKLEHENEHEKSESESPKKGLPEPAVESTK